MIRRFIFLLIMIAITPIIAFSGLLGTILAGVHYVTTGKDYDVDTMPRFFIQIPYIVTGL